jgi:hypothetical protein
MSLQMRLGSDDVTHFCNSNVYNSLFASENLRQMYQEKCNFLKNRDGV